MDGDNSMSVTNTKKLIDILSDIARAVIDKLDNPPEKMYVTEMADYIHSISGGSLQGVHYDSTSAPGLLKVDMNGLDMMASNTFIRLGKNQITEIVDQNNNPIWKYEVPTYSGLSSYSWDDLKAIANSMASGDRSKVSEFKSYVGEHIKFPTLAQIKYSTTYLTVWVYATLAAVNYQMTDSEDVQPLVFHITTGVPAAYELTDTGQWYSGVHNVLAQDSGLEPPYINTITRQVTPSIGISETLSVTDGDDCTQFGMSSVLCNCVNNFCRGYDGTLTEFSQYFRKVKKAIAVVPRAEGATNYKYTSWQAGKVIHQYVNAWFPCSGEMGTTNTDATGSASSSSVQSMIPDSHVILSGTKLDLWNTSYTDFKFGRTDTAPEEEAGQTIVIPSGYSASQVFLRDIAAVYGPTATNGTVINMNACLLNSANGDTIGYSPDLITSTHSLTGTATGGITSTNDNLLPTFSL
jgi:hypothetical protein